MRVRATPFANYRPTTTDVRVLRARVQEYQAESQPDASITYLLTPSDFSIVGLDRAF